MGRGKFHGSHISPLCTALVRTNSTGRSTFSFPILLLDSKGIVAVTHGIARVGQSSPYISGMYHFSGMLSYVTGIEDRPLTITIYVYAYKLNPMHGPR